MRRRVAVAGVIALGVLAMIFAVGQACERLLIAASWPT
jgi:hypothetical protein